MKNPHVVMVAGEVSGDQHTAKVAAALQAINPQIKISGIGGTDLRAQGMETIYRSEDLSVMGATAVVAKLKDILSMLAGMKRYLNASRPDLLILADFPDFNFRLAAYAKKIGIKVLYYISPQIWAWRTYRVRKMVRIIDHLAVILPFEKSFYHKMVPDFPVTYVGNPMMEELEENFPPWPWPDSQEIVGLLPGSRKAEIENMLPIMLQSVREIKKQRPDLKYALALAPGLEVDFVRQFMGPDDDMVIMEHRTRQVMEKSKLLLVTSGTSTLQAAIAGTPMVVIFKTNDFNYLLGHRLIKVDHIALPNLIAGYRLVPELLQYLATSELLTAHSLHLLNDKLAWQTSYEGLQMVKARLGGPGASLKVAEIAFSLME